MSPTHPSTHPISSYLMLGVGIAYQLSPTGMPLVARSWHGAHSL